MVLKTEHFFKNRVLNSRIVILFAITFSVLIMGVLGVIVLNYNSLGKTLKENISFNLVLNEDIPELEIQQLIKSFSLLEDVKSVSFISKSESSKNLTDELGENFVKVLGENPLPNIIELRFHSSFLDKTTPITQKKRFLLYDEVDEVVYDETLLILIENNFNRTGLVLFVIAILFFLLAFSLINSNIRLTIYSKRFSIKTMQLVGATKRFIQKPFLISNIQYTIIACLLGNSLLVLLLHLVNIQLPELEKLISLKDLGLLMLGITLINILISLFSTWICVRKYLNLNTEDLYK